MKEHDSGNRVLIKAEAVCTEVTIAAGGLLSGCFYFVFVAGLGFFCVVFTLISLAEPTELVPRYAAAAMAVGGVLFALGGLSVARSRGQASIDEHHLRITQIGLFFRKRLSEPLVDVLEVKVSDSNVSINGRAVPEMEIALTSGSQRFFRHLPNADLDRVVECLNRALTARETAKTPRQADRDLAGRIPVTRKRTLSAFLLAFVPIAILFGVGSLISWLAGIHTVTLTRNSDHQVLCITQQRLLLLIRLPPKTVEDLTSASARRVSNHESAMTLVGTDNSVTVPGGSDTAASIVAFISDPEEELKSIWVGNPLAELGAFIFASIGMIFLVLVVAHTVTPVFGFLQVKTSNVHLSGAVGQLSKSPVSPRKPMAIYAEQVRLLRILQWQPGERLHMVSSLPPSWRMTGVILFGMIGIVPCWLLLGHWIWPLCQSSPLIADWLPWLLCFVPGGALGYLFIALKSPSRRVNFDMSRGYVHWRIGARSGSAAITDIQRLVVRPVREETPGASSGDRQTRNPPIIGYRSRLDMVLPSREITILDTDRAFHLYKNQQGPVEAIKPLADWIAQKTNVQIRTGSVVDDPKFLHLMWQKHKLLSLGIGALCLVMVGMTINAMVQPMLAQRQITKLGGSESGYSSSIRDDVIIADGRHYDFSDTALTDSQFAEVVLRIVADRKPVALSLANTQVTDNSVTQLVGATNIRVLRLSGCEISDASAAHLASLTGLVQLNLMNTEVTDATLEQLGKLQRLRYLSLGSEQRSPISDGGIRYLLDLTNLRRLYLRNTDVTDAMIGELRSMLPNADIVVPEF